MKLIEKELEKSKVPNHELKEVKLILDNCHQEDINILRGLSKNSELNILEKNYGKRLNLENLDKEWNGNVYHIDEIKKLCIKYRLRFLSSQYYKGKFDTETVQKVKNLKEFNKDVIDSYSLKHDFYMMAPPEMFSLDEAKYVSKKQLDPVLFYKIDEAHFKKVHAFGKDFTILRRIIGWKWEDSVNEFIFNFSVSFCACAILLSFIFPVIMYQHYLMLNFFSLVASLLLSLKLAHPDQDPQIQGEGGFFTPSNWRSTQKLK